VIAAGLFSTHVPRLMILDPQARKEYMREDVTTFYDALEQIRRERIADLDFDTFVLIDTHWHTTLEFVLNAHQRHAGLYT
jgi:aromatic ring-opening dioxygenase catalytic subunit (LigB family)